MFRRRLGVYVCGLIVVPVSVGAQGTPPIARATRIAAPITIDGRLDEDAWASAEPLDGFRQRDPREGEAATEATVVKLLYDGSHLYVGATLHDSESARILATELRRDADLDGDDRFGVLLDTFGDDRHGFLFRVNPNGTRFDAAVRNESRVDADWDEQWWVETRIDDDGWTVEMQIPFRILRFDPSNARSWGVDFERVIRRKNEETYWANWDRDFEFIQVSQAGELAAMDRIRPGQRLRIRPYVLGGVESLETATSAGVSRARGDVGIDDLQVTVASNLMANIAVNPDFAETEIDEQRVNLTRFSLFFPEKREFFVQGADSLRMSSPLDDGESFELFHSRRVGLTEDGRPIPILIGGKLTGKVHDVDLGVFGGRTAAEGSVQGENFGVVRFRRELLGRSSVGAIATVRDGAGAARGTVGADARFVVARYLTLAGMAARADPESGGAGWARSLAAAWQSDFIEAEASHLSVDPGFDPAVGFVRRHDRQTEVDVSVNPRPSVGPVRQVKISPGVTFNQDRGGQLISREADFDLGADFQSGDAIELGLENVRENLSDEFEIADGVVLPVGRYGWNSVQIGVESFEGRRLSGSLSVDAGGFYSGTRRSLEASATLRAGRHLRMSPDYELNDITLAEGAFTTHLFGLRTDVSFNRDAVASLFFQYNSDGRLAATQVRFSYLFRNIDNLHVVYNDTRVSGTGSSRAVGRSLVAKLTYSLYR